MWKAEKRNWDLKFFNFLVLPYLKIEALTATEYNEFSGDQTSET
jgi:hypothetical protein